MLDDKLQKHIAEHGTDEPVARIETSLVKKTEKKSKQNKTTQGLQLFNPFRNKSSFFTCLQCKSFKNTVGKGDIALDKQFLLFPQCFLPFWRTFSIFIKFGIVVCKLFQFGRV